MWRLCCKIYLVGSSFWTFYDVRSERGILIRVEKGSSRVLILTLWWSLAWFLYYYSNWPWPYCDYYISLYLLLKCAIFLYMIFARKKKTNKSNIKKVNCFLEFWNFWKHDIQYFHRNLTDFKSIHTKFQNPADITMPANIYLFFWLQSFFCS